MLKRGLEKVELTPIPIISNQFSIHAHAVIPQLMQEQANGSTSWASKALPGCVSLVVGWGGRGKRAQQHGVNLGAIRPLVGITSIDAVNKGSEMWVLNKIAAQAHHPSGQNLCNRFEVCKSRSVEGHGVRRDMIVRPDGLRHSGVKKTHGSGAVGCDFTAVHPSGEHQSANDSLLGVVVPVEMVQLTRKGCSNCKPVVESAAEQPNALRGMGPQVPEVQNDWDGLVKGNPDMVGKLGPGFGQSGE